MENWPVEVMTDILSRLPVKKIIHCKCVCKKWLNIVSDSYFASLHLLRSPAGFMVHIKSEEVMNSYYNPGKLKWVEVEDELDHHHLHHDPVMSLDLDVAPIFQDSYTHMVGLVDGLICLRQIHNTDENYVICNPITREYMILPTKLYCENRCRAIGHGVGVGLVTKEYKVVCIFDGAKPQNAVRMSGGEITSKSIGTFGLQVEVYTLGTGQWRSLGHLPYSLEGFTGSFLNGHAHWFVDDKNSPEKLYAFDFDDETFKLFPSPPVEGSEIPLKTLGVLKGCLCQCDVFDFEIVIWVMKEYGIKTSWHKEVIIKRPIACVPDMMMMRLFMDLIQRLCDGTILILCNEQKLLAYSCEKGTIVDTDYVFTNGSTVLAYRPNFLKLRNFDSERVHVF